MGSLTVIGERHPRRRLMLGVGIDRVGVIAEVMRDLYEDPDMTGDIHATPPMAASYTLAYRSVVQGVESAIAHSAPADEVSPAFDTWRVL